jgi:hypothetical protein
MAKDKIRPISDFVLYKAKDSGIAAGGIYKLKPELVKEGEDPDTLYFFKLMPTQQTMSELMGSNMARVLLGDSAPENYLVKNGNELWTASKQIKNFITMFDFKELAKIPPDCWPNGCIVKENGQVERITSFMLNREGDNGSKVHIFQDAIKTQEVINFLEHGDAHELNYGVILDDGQKKSALIDFSLSLVGRSNHHPKTAVAGTLDQQLSQAEIAFSINVSEEFLSKRLMLNKAISDTADYLKHAGFNKEEVERFSQEVSTKMDNRFSNLENATIVRKFILAQMSGHSVKRFFDPKKSNVLAIVAQVDENLQKNFYAAIFRLHAKNEKITGIDFGKMLLEQAAKSPATVKYALVDIIKAGDTELFKQMLPYIGENRHTSAEALIALLQTENEAMIKLLMPYIEKNKDEIYGEFIRYTISKSFAQIVSSGNDKIFKLLIPYMSEGGKSAMVDAFLQAISQGEQSMFEQMLPYMKGSLVSLENGLRKAVLTGNEKMVGQMLPYFQNEPPTYAAGGLMNAITTGNKKIFKQILPYINNSSYFMGKSLKAAVTNGSDDFFEELLALAKDKPIDMDDGFAAAVTLGNEKMFERILAYVKDEPINMVDGFMAAVTLGKEKMFERMLPLIGKEPSYMKRVLLTALKQGQEKMFEEMLPYMKGFPDTLVPVLEEAIITGKQNLFDQILPCFSKENSSALSASFAATVKTNNLPMFESLLPYMERDPSSMAAAFAQATLNGNVKMFERMLPHIKKEPECMSAGLANAVDAGQVEMFNQILPHIKNQPASLRLGLTAAVRSGKQDFFNQILPHIKNDPDAMYEAFKCAAITGNDVFIEKMLPYMRDFNAGFFKATDVALSTAKQLGYDKIVQMLALPQPSLFSRLFNMLDFLPNFPRASASSEMRPMPIITAADIEKASVNVPASILQPSIEKPAPITQVQQIASAQPQAQPQAASVTSSYPGSPGMALLAAGMIGKAIYDFAISSADRLTATKAQPDEITAARKNFKKVLKASLNKIQEIDDAISERRTDLRNRLAELDALPRLSHAEKLEKTELTKEYQGIKEITDKCVDLKATLAAMKRIFYKDSEMDVFKPKADLALSEDALAKIDAGVKQVEDEVVALEERVEKLNKPEPAKTSLLESLMKEDYSQSWEVQAKQDKAAPKDKGR